jgi:hypothetical protein
MHAVGRSATDLLLRTCHSARQIRDRRHPANLDTFQSIATGSYAVFQSRRPQVAPDANSYGHPMPGGTAIRGNIHASSPSLELDVAAGSHGCEINQPISQLGHERAGPRPTKLRCHFDGGSNIAVRTRWPTVSLLGSAMVT